MQLDRSPLLATPVLVLCTQVDAQAVDAGTTSQQPSAVACAKACYDASTLYRECFGSIDDYSTPLGAHGHAHLAPCCLRMPVQA